MDKTVQTRLFEWLIKARFSFTGIGSALGILVLFGLYSAGLVIEPNALVWASSFIVGGGLGLVGDQIQNYLSKKL